MQRSDLPLLRSWFTADHVAAWWDTPDDPEYKYFDSGRPVHHFIATFDGRPVGMVQCYRWFDFPDQVTVVGARPGEIGIDYLLGDGALVGLGIGPAMIGAFLAQLTATHDDVIGVRVDVAAANRRSWRALEKLGFKRERTGVEIAGELGPHHIYVR